MMSSTASVQINLDAGTGSVLARRWRLAHSLSPMLAAAFANSPFVQGVPSGWRSTRLANWWAIDPSRTLPAGVPRTTPEEAWERYALGARVMLIRATPDRFVPIASGLSLERWIEEGHELGYPAEDDVIYHLTTLFPPVRARGWLEIRAIDALPDPYWRVPVAIATALVYDEDAAEVAERATAVLRDKWIEAFRFGLAHPALAAAALTCFPAALEALPRLGLDERTRALVESFFERYTARGRVPADELLENWIGNRSLLPDREVSWI